jgi:curved DNA-binding protein CbpA
MNRIRHCLIRLPLVRQSLCHYNRHPITQIVRHFSSTRLPDYIVDYYSVLKCTRETSYDDMKASYHALAKQYHPDKAIALNLSTEEAEARERQWKAICHAWHVLGSVERRRHYDTFVSLSSVGDSDRIRHYVKVNRPYDQLHATSQTRTK